MTPPRPNLLARLGRAIARALSPDSEPPPKAGLGTPDHAARIGKCPACGYTLRESMAVVCPECGFDNIDAWRDKPRPIPRANDAEHTGGP